MPIESFFSKRLYLNKNQRYIKKFKEDEMFGFNFKKFLRCFSGFYVHFCSCCSYPDFCLSFLEVSLYFIHNCTTHFRNCRSFCLYLHMQHHLLIVSEATAVIILIHSRLLSVAECNNRVYENGCEV